MAAIMGLSVSLSSILIHQNSAPIKRCSRMLAHNTSNPNHIKATPLIQIKSFIKLHKVFEDQSSGIVCYRDDKGEITCEGYDEGPRLTSDERRNAAEEVMELVHKRLLQVVDKGEAKHAAADKDELNRNGFNSTPLN